MLLRKFADLARGEQFSKTIERKHDIRILSARGRIEMTGYETDLSRIRVVWNETETDVVVGEGLHALDIRTRRTDEGDTAFF
jgi:hypothetical protein